jgi:pimeloyl-ACP methyl ester carboxylesterase
MQPLARILADETRVYAPDLPGYGESEANGCGTDVPSLAAVLDRWMDVAGLSQAIIVANSFGCQIAARLAASYPHRVRDLVLLGPVVEPSARSLPVLMVRGLINSFIEPPSLGPIIARDLLAMGIPRAISLLQSMLTDRIEDTLPSISAPTLIVRGEKDPLVSTRWIEALARRLSAGRAAAIPDAGHALNYNAPVRVAQLVRDFIRSSRRAPAEPDCVHDAHPREGSAQRLWVADGQSAAGSRLTAAISASATSLSITRPGEPASRYF